MHILTSGSIVNHRKSDRISSIFINQLQRIRRVSKRFWHFPSQLISHDSMEKHIVKRHFFHLIQSKHYHSRYSEKDDVCSRYEGWSRIKMLQKFSFFWSSHRWKWPKCRGEPSIKHIIFLLQTHFFPIKS